MSWLVLTIGSAFLLGFYDYFKKLALRDNAVIPVLFGSICAGALVWLPFVAWSAVSPATLPLAFLHVTDVSGHDHFLLFLKAILVGASWLCGYIGIKSLPLSIATPIRATGPLWTILFAVLIFNESPAPRQWLGVSIILLAFFAFTFVGQREGICFHREPAVFYMLGATLLGAASALYDKFLLQTAGIAPGAVQAWFSIYLTLILVPVILIWMRSKNRHPFSWHWAIPTIGITLLAADFLYFTAISQPEALISLISPARRTSVIVSFLLGICLFKENNVLGKGVCVAGIVLGVILLA